MSFQELVLKLMNMRWSFTLYNGTNMEDFPEELMEHYGEDVYILEVYADDEVYLILEKDSDAIESFVKVLESW